MLNSYCAACSSVFIDNRFEQHHTIASRSRACEYQALLRTSIPAWYTTGLHGGGVSLTPPKEGNDVHTSFYTTRYTPVIQHYSSGTRTIKSKCEDKRRFFLLPSHLRSSTIKQQPHLREGGTTHSFSALVRAVQGIYMLLRMVYHISYRIASTSSSLQKATTVRP